MADWLVGLGDMEMAYVQARVKTAMDGTLDHTDDTQKKGDGRPDRAGTWKRSLNDTLGHANDAQKKEMGELIVAGVELRVTVRPVRGADGQKRAKAGRYGLARANRPRVSLCACPSRVHDAHGSAARSRVRLKVRWHSVGRRSTAEQAGYR